MSSQTGRGATLAYATITGGVVGTYIPIAKVISVSGPSLSIGEVETTLLSSVFKPYIPTLPEGEASFTLDMDNNDTSVAYFRDLFQHAPVPIVSFKLTLQDLSNAVFQGFPKSFKVSDVENETRLTVDLDVRITTGLVWSLT